MDWNFILGFAAILAAGIIICLIYDRLTKRKLQQGFQKLQADIKAGKIPEPNLENEKNGTISIDTDGFTVTYSRRKHRQAKILLDNVTRIETYKRDLFTTDLLCFSFSCRDDEDMVEVNEEMLGFKELMKVIESRFDIKQEDWWQEVILPAFETNMTVIWPKNADKTAK